MTLTETIIPKNNLDFFQQALLSSIDDAVISTDRNFTITSWNAAAERIYEITADEAIGKKTTELIFQQYFNNDREEVLRILVNEDYWKGLIRAITKSGKVVFLQSIFTVVKDAENKKIGYVAVSRDVTADLQHKQSLQNFSSVLSILDESFLIVNRDFEVVFLSPKGKVENFFNSNYKVGDYALKYIPALHTDVIKANYLKAFNGELIQYRAESDDEPKLYFDVTYTPLKDDFDHITNVCVIIKDFTPLVEKEILEEKKTAIEKSYIESRKLFEEFMENSPLLAWVVDEKGCIQYINKTYRRALNFKDEIVGKNILDIYPKEFAERSMANTLKAIEKGIAIETIEKGRIPNKQTILKIIKFPIFFKDETMVAAWGINISDQIAMQESLSLLNQNKNKIMSVIAHDVRGPLRLNTDFIDVIIDDYDTLQKEEMLEHLNMLRTGISKCCDLTEEILLWAKSQLESVKYNPAALETNNVIIRVIENIVHVATDKKITIIQDFCEAGKIYADADMFSIVLRNFITNAIKFSKARSKIVVATTIRENKLWVSVKDTGTGIKKELVEKLMHKLNYESCYGTKGEKGAGLGLIIAKDYIEKNNGEMLIESEEGKGSIFSFSVGFAED